MAVGDSGSCQSELSLTALCWVGVAPAVVVGSAEVEAEWDYWLAAI